MGSVFSAIGSLMVKGKMATLLAEIGIFSGGLAALIAAIKLLLPSPAELAIVFIILASFGAISWLAVDQLKARQAKRDIEVARAQAEANKVVTS